MSKTLRREPTADRQSLRQCAARQSQRWDLATEVEASEPTTEPEVTWADFEEAMNASTADWQWGREGRVWVFSD